jgi:hypothetical protein
MSKRVQDGDGVNDNNNEMDGCDGDVLNADGEAFRLFWRWADEDSGYKRYQQYFEVPVNTMICAFINTLQQVFKPLCAPTPKEYLQWGYISSLLENELHLPKDVAKLICAELWNYYSSDW